MLAVESEEEEDGEVEALLPNELFWVAEVSLWVDAAVLLEVDEL